MNDPRITQYALGELRGAEREEFEKELAQSEELQRELQKTIAVCESLRGLPSPENALEGQQRAALRESCRANVKVAPRRVERKRIIVYGALGALAACLLLMPLMPWAEVSRIANSQPEAKRDATPKFVIETSIEPATAPATGGSNVMSGTLEIPTTSPLIAATNTPTAPARVLAKDQIVVAATKAETDRLLTFTHNEPRAAMTHTANFSSGAPVDRSIPSTVSSPLIASSGSMGGPSFHVSPERKSELIRQYAATQGRAQIHDENYASAEENAFHLVAEHPLSTFSIDVDTASYANVRRFLQKDQLPPREAVRIEELVNYFPYDYSQPKDGKPFSVNVEAAAAPWNPEHELVRIALKGKDVPVEERGPANLVFLIDVSGSMQAENKLPLLKRSLHALVKYLSPKDKVAIVVYAGTAELALPPTSGKDRLHIQAALNSLKPNGGTNGGEGIELAYRTARENFIKDGNNRIILCSDGDFNVGITDQSDLVTVIERERRSGVFLSVLGFGEGNLKDATMEKLADKGNGNYSYIDSFAEGRKVLVEQMSSTLFTIAKDVKIQVEFNPAQVAGYRLIGYENRILAKEDFNNDKKDAGEIGAGHTVTALYEIVRAGQPMPDLPSVDPLKYQSPPPATIKAEAAPVSRDLLTVKLRYKAPDGDKSLLIEKAIPAGELKPFDKASSDFQFAAAVAAFGLKLRGSEHTENITWAEIQKIARRNLNEDSGSYRAEFLTLVERAAKLDRDSRE